MPSHRYKPVGGRCRLCGDGFECVQSASEPAFVECPKCGLEVERVVPDTLNTPRILKPMSVTDAKSAGMTVLKRTCDGSFEKL